jgi:para-nitrobenzyl esterase
MKRLLYVSGFLASLAAFGAAAALPEQITVDTGTLAGGTGATPDVRAYKGIPFAAPPVGANRWRAPQAAAKWQGVRPATDYAARCMQGGPPGANAAAPPATSEDCLYLNVWSAAGAATERRPVMVWIYGGGYFGGAGSEPRYAGDALASKGAVVVTLNYRLGTFGFLAHPQLSAESDRKISGNYAVQDSLAALQWVQRNIAAFGGDPANVTLFGESAGANMTSALVGSPQAKGLFHRAIVQSGAWMGMSMGRMTPLASAEEAGAKAANDFGATSIAELRAKPAQEIHANLRAPAGLVVDGYYIPEDLSLTFTNGRQNAVDVLVGSNQDEGTFFPRPGLTAQQFTSEARQRFGVLAESYLKIYPANDDAGAMTAYLASFRDETAWQMRKFAELQTKRGNEAYVYYFTRVPPSPPDRPSRGASHVAEIPYMFNNLPANVPWTDTDRALAATMSSYWVNFARSGNPNGPGLPPWPAYRGATTGQAQVLGDSVATETATTPAAATLRYFDSAYRQLLEGGASR